MRVPSGNTSLIKNKAMNNQMEIAIVGMSAKLPESENLEEFWKNLINGIDMVTDDNRRWKTAYFDMPPRSGKLIEIAKFDAEYFGIPAKVVQNMDPSTGLLLELTHEAIVDGGVNPVTMRGTDTAVIICSVSSTMPVMLRSSVVPDGYLFVGTATCMAANRVSYAFDFKGISHVVESACSSSLVGLHCAYNFMRLGLCGSAIVGGTYLHFFPQETKMLSNFGVLSKDGKCKAFDEIGDGFVRSESAAVLFLMKYDEAKRVYATVVNVKCNNDGYKPDGITFPSATMQAKLIQAIYTESCVDTSEVLYIEAHGTGTQAGDWQEITSIDQVFCPDSSKPLLIGSVKSNMGHAEVVAGLCGIIKVILAHENKIIPKNLHYNIPNPKLKPIIEERIKVVDENISFVGQYVGINCFGAGGTNAHALLKLPDYAENTIWNPQIPKIILGSGRTKDALSYLFEKSIPYSTNQSFVTLLHNISIFLIPGHSFRGYAIIFGGNRSICIEECSKSLNPPVWFIFMGLIDDSKVLKNLNLFEIFNWSVELASKCLESDAYFLMKSLNKPVLEWQDAMVLTIAVQAGLIDLLASIGISPSGIIGRSIGEISAAYADGCFNLDQAIRLVLRRAKGMLECEEIVRGNFSHASIKCSWEDAQAFSSNEIIPLIHDAEDSVIIEGESKYIERLIEELTKQNISAKLLKYSGLPEQTSYAKSCKKHLEKVFKEIIWDAKLRSNKWVSTSVRIECGDSDSALAYSSAEYHVNSMISPVLFYDALKQIPENSVVVHFSMEEWLGQVIAPTLSKCDLIGLVSNTNESDGSQSFCTSIGKMYIQGTSMNIAGLYPRVNYPVMSGTPLISPLIRWDHHETWELPSYSKGSVRVAPYVKPHATEILFKVLLYSYYNKSGVIP